jgi:hypothetical protein
MKTIHLVMLFLTALSITGQQLAADPSVGKYAAIFAAVATSLLSVLAHVSPSVVNPAPAPAVVTATVPAPAPAVVTAPTTTP